MLESIALQKEGHQGIAARLADGIRQLPRYVEPGTGLVMRPNPGAETGESRGGDRLDNDVRHLVCLHTEATRGEEPPAKGGERFDRSFASRCDHQLGNHGAWHG